VEAGRGTQASLVALPQGNVATAADGLPSAQLTTVSLNGLTAWAALKELALKSGQTLVDAGAAGSVGGFALELAAVRGIRVIAAVSVRDRDYVLGLGASDVAVREDGDIGAAVRKIAPGGADALFDTTTSLGSAGLGAIKDGGLHVTSTDPPESERGIRVAKIYGLPDGGALQRLADMATAGQLHTRRPGIQRRTGTGRLPGVHFRAPPGTDRSDLLATEVMPSGATMAFWNGLYSATRTRTGDGTAMPGSLTGKTAVVTGVSHSIGQAMARRFAEAGARLVLTELAED
jgi:hypothetical protein